MAAPREAADSWLRDAPNGRVLRVDAHEESLAKATVVVPETDDVLTSGEVVGTIVLLPASDALYLRLLRKGAGQVMRIPYDIRGPTSVIPLPRGLQVTTATSSDSTPGGPVLLRVNADSGHGWDTTAQRVSDNSDNFTFLLWRFGDPDFQPKEL